MKNKNSGDFMKRIILLLICILISLAGCGIGVSDSPVSSPTAAEVADAMNLGINLGNTLEAFSADGGGETSYDWPPPIENNTPEGYEVFWGATPASQKVIDGMKKAGFDTLRIPVFWGNMMEKDGNWTINEDFIERVKEVVDYTQKADMYCVINIHHYDEFIIRRHTVDECEEIFSRLWTQIAEAFKDYDYRLVFEGFNEALGGKQFNEDGVLVEPGEFQRYLMTNTCNQAFVDAVRATGGNNAERVLIVCGYSTDADKTSEAQFVLPKDTVPDRLMVSIHYLDNLMYWTNSLGTQQWLDYVDRQCNKLDESFKEAGVPVFVGETTCSYPWDRFALGAEYQNSAECVEMVLNKQSERGYVSVLWTAGNGWYDRESCTITDSEYAEMVARVAKRLRK